MKDCRNSTTDTVQNPTGTSSPDDRMVRLISNLWSSLAATNHRDMRATVARAIESIGQYNKLDRCTVFLFRRDSAVIDTAHDWRRK